MIYFALEKSNLENIWVPDASSNGHFLNQTIPQSDNSQIEELSILRKCPFEEVSDSIFSLYSLWKKSYKLFFDQVPSPWDISDVGQRQFATIPSKSFFLQRKFQLEKILLSWAGSPYDLAQLLS